MTLRGESRRGVTYDSERFEGSDEIRADKAASPIVEGFTAIIELGPAILWEREPSRHSVVFDPIAHEDASARVCRAIRQCTVDLQLLVGAHHGKGPYVGAQLDEVQAVKTYVLSSWRRRTEEEEGRIHSCRTDLTFLTEKNAFAYLLDS